MKLSLAVCLGLLVTSASALAADGTINFTGDINGNTCTINGGAEGSNTQSVALGSVPVSALQKQGDLAGMQPFSIQLTNCDSTGTSVAARFESLTLGSPDGHLMLTGNGTQGVAKNVMIALYDSKNNLQPVNGTVPTESYTTFTSTGEGEAAVKSATLNYIAAYYATGKSEAGTANSTVSYTLSYQ